eukprot:COSAG06_NODE_34246_length_477_cov_1.089947_1_plen_86_part_00
MWLLLSCNFAVMNLLIALMGGSYERVEESATNEGLKKRAELIIGFEDMMRPEEHDDETIFPQWLHFFKPTDADSNLEAAQRGKYT